MADTDVQNPPAATTPAPEPKFKIGASGTHSTQVGPAPSDTPASDTGNADTATPPTGAQADQNSNTPAADAGTGEPPKATHSAKLGSSKPPPSSATPPPAATPDATPPPPKTFEEILKEQGFDEQFINLAKVYKQDGNISRYAQAMNTDFTKMPAEELHRLKIQKDYPGATQEQLDLLYESEIREKYKLDADTFDPESKEAKAAKVKMELEAGKLRTEFTKENEQFKLPAKDVAAETQQQTEAAIAVRKAKQDALFAQPYSQSVLTDKKLVLKDLSMKDETGKVIAAIPDFTMELDDPNEIKEIMTNPTAYSRYMTDDKGNPDPEATFQVAAFAMNRVAFCQALINQGKMLGREEMEEKAYNPPGLRNGAAAASSKETLNEAFAKRGKDGKAGG